jgi:hypothetical protein
MYKYPGVWPIHGKTDDEVISNFWKSKFGKSAKRIVEIHGTIAADYYMVYYEPKDKNWRSKLERKRKR